MISPQSIAIGAASVGLVGKESDLFRFTAKHSLIMLSVICLLTLAQAYALRWIIPSWELSDVKAVTANHDPSLGYTYLLILAGLLIAYLALLLFNAKRNPEGNQRAV
jgi:lactate permease